MAIFRAGKYLRLSNEDSGKKDVSESIENQSNIIDNYLQFHPDIEVYDTYIDDGKTGMNYDRDDFKRMMNEINAGYINCVIVKDLSRIGREHCETIYLLKKLFPVAGVRFIAVVDNIDIKDTINQGVDVPFKVVVNDYYSQNISNQVRNAFATKQTDGKFTGSFASYGYIKDPKDKNHLIPDPQTAPIVQRIFKEFLDGKSIRSIARDLNNEGIYSPSAYKRIVQKFSYRNYHTELDTEHWTYSTIKAMLKKEVYIGNMIQHRTESISYNIRKKRYVPKEQWRTKENTHEGIIDVDTFEKVQNIINERNYRQRDFDRTPRSLYRGILFCGDCGYAMSRIKYKQTEKTLSSGFRCGQYARQGKGYCTSHSINKKTLDEIVLTEIRKNIEEVLKIMDSDELLKLLKGKNKDAKSEQISHLEERKKALLIEKKNMLSNLSKKVIAEEDFLLYNETYKDEMDKIEQSIIELQSQISEDSIEQKRYSEWIEHFLQYRNITEINRDILVNLIERINIYENKVVEIKFYFRNPFE